MKTTDQLAAEARQQIKKLLVTTRITTTTAFNAEVDAIIKSAIEEATEGWQSDCESMAKRINILMDFLERCADHMICGSDIADTTIPTRDEWREILKTRRYEKYSSRAARASEQQSADTKRLNWILAMLNDGYWPLSDSKEKSRRAIDAAMSQEQPK